MAKETGRWMEDGWGHGTVGEQHKKLRPTKKREGGEVLRKKSASIVVKREGPGGDEKVMANTRRTHANGASSYERRR